VPTSSPASAHFASARWLEIEFEPSDNSDQAAHDRMAVRATNWYGALPDVEHRLKVLQQQRDDAQSRLDAALREPVTA
jgi:hypothetical protein